ncbi:MAG TPA: Hsp70 family protein, partial [Ktedonobacterales bacterium]
MSQPDHTMIGLGLDIGMTYCGAAVSYYSDSDSWIRVEVIETGGQGSEYREPSKLFYLEGMKEPLIGLQAQSRYLDGAKGRFVERFKRWFAHFIKRDENLRAITDTAELIKYLKRNIDRYLSATGLNKRQPRYAFSHPGSWGNDEKRDFLKAINAAGIGSAALIEEPVAAALAAAFIPALAHNLRGERVVLVCDIGGGTTDLSLVTFDAGGAIKMLGQTDGNPELGMSNLDQLIGLMIIDKTRGISDPDDRKPLAYADVVGKHLQSAWDKLSLTP